MFDTSLVREHAISGPRGVTLFASILAHSAVTFALIALTLVSTQLPQEPPRQFALYRAALLPASPPPPLGRPALPKPSQQPAVQHPHAVVAPQPATAPRVIPDQTPVLSADPAPAAGPASADANPGSGPIGSPDGVPDGVGSAGVGSGPSIPGPYTPGAGVTPAHVLTRVEPRFPPLFAHSVRTAVVAVRCVIGQHGEIRDPEIVTSSFPPFNEAVLSALRQWTFAPGMMHGHPVDTWFELTVKFQVR